jgi:hypothetical protein
MRVPPLESPELSMRDFASLAPALLFLALPLASRAASIQVLSSARSITTSAYLTDDVIEMSDNDADSTFTLGPYSKAAESGLTFGPITCTSSANQTSTYAISAFHASGSHNCFAEDTGTAGFGTSYGSSTFHVVFRLTESSGYELSGFVQGADLGYTTITFAGPGGSILSLTAGGQTLPVQKTGVLSPGDYDLDVNSYGSAHGWPPFPSYSSGAYEIHFALDSATDAPHAARAASLSAFPNPFAASTRIHASEMAGDVSVYDAAGRIVRKFEGAAFYEWDGRDERGAAIPAGVYFIRETDSPAATTFKLIRVR